MIETIGALPHGAMRGTGAPATDRGAARAAEAFVATLQAGEHAAADAMAGAGDPHEMVMALSEARLALEATVALRDRAVEAYQDLLRMPV